MRLIFHGELRKRFGEFFDIEATTIADAIDGFSRQVEWPRDLPVSIIGYRTEESLQECPDSVRLVPAARGGSGKFFNIVLGAAMIVAGVLIGGPWLAPLVISGSLMVLQGVVMMFMKAPKYNKSNDPDASKYVTLNKNTTVIGTPMTMAWGTIDLGGHWLSLQSDSNNLSYGVFPTNPT